MNFLSSPGPSASSLFPPLPGIRDQRPRCLCWEREDRWLLALRHAGAEATWELCPVAPDDTPNFGSHTGKTAFLVISADLLDQPATQTFITSLVNATPPLSWVVEIPPHASPLLSLWLYQAGAVYVFDSPLQAPQLLDILQRQASIFTTNPSGNL
ncbi:MAG: hypothetical protein SFX18_03405 [Pirellulales bacterium]|nr:hypothetical protein [Pirellulales bacterium]